MRKKFGRFAVVLGMTALLSVNTFAASFVDVAEGNWAYEAIEYMYDMRYMTGTTDGKFIPKDTVSYFDLAEILAKATGYVDEKIDKNMDPALKESIRKNYEQQLPKIQAYDTKYQEWKTGSNEEIAYLLGKGILKDTDLNRFVLKTASGVEVKNILVKQDLAAMLVRFMGLDAEKEAITEYTTTGMTDESLIREENRPHVAYLKKHNIANGNSEGAFGANDQMTRELVATMIYRGVGHKATLEPAEPEVKPEAEKEESQVTLATYKVKNILAKSDGTGEHYIIFDANGTSKHYTATKDLKVVDQAGTSLTLEAVKIGSEVTVQVGEEGNRDVVFKMILNDQVEPETDLEEDLTEEEDKTEEDNKKEDNDKEEADEDEEEAKTVIYKGEVEEINDEDELTLDTTRGSVTYEVHRAADITFGEENLDLDEIREQDYIEIEVEDDQIVAIEVIERAEEEPVEGHFVEWIQSGDTQKIVIETEDEEETTYILDESAVIVRNEDEADIDELRVGDELVLEIEDDLVVSVEAESDELEIQGHLKSILIASQPEITVTTKKGDQTVVITEDTEIFDDHSRENLSIRELMLGAKVEIVAESSEALSISAQEVADKITYKGSIESVGAGARYIDVLIEYDPITGETMLEKRINVPSEVEIIVDNEESYRKKLEEGMEVLIKYNYEDRLYPISIEVID